MTLKENKLLIISSALLLAFGGCTPKQPELPQQDQNQSALQQSTSEGTKSFYTVLIKTPRLKFYDTAFITKDGSKTVLQAYQAGTSALELEVGYKVCIDGTCMDKSRFNQEFLHPDYAKETIANILNGQPLMNGYALHQVKGGFVQHLKTPSYLIKYEVADNNISFKDEMNGIKIKLTKQ